MVETSADKPGENYRRMITCPSGIPAGGTALTFGIMYFRIILFVLGFIYGSSLTGQGRWDYVWPAGYENLKDTFYPGIGGHDMNFNQGKITLPNYYRPINYAGFANAAICDENGNLLYQGNGCFILGPDDQILPGSDSLMFGTPRWYNSLCDIKDHSSAYRVESSLQFLPLDIIDKTVVLNQVTDDVYYPHLTGLTGATVQTRISMIDNSTNQMELKAKTINTDTLQRSFMATVRAQDQGWTTLMNEVNSNIFKTIHIDPNGTYSIDSFIFHEMPVDVSRAAGIVHSQFNPQGTRLAWYNSGGQYLGHGGLHLADYDASTERLTNYKFLYINDSLKNKELPFLVGQIAFSPSGRFLYLSQLDYVMQFDLEASDPSQSGVIIGYDDLFQDSVSGLSVNLWSMKLGPDCRIWMSSTNGSRFYHVINFPDRKGRACGFQLRAVVSPSYRFGPFPHQPFYRTGTPYPVCDSTILLPGTVNTAWLEETREWMPLVHTPNPVSTQLKVYTELPPGGAGELNLYDMYGQLIYTAPLVVGSNEIMVDTDGWSSGLYYSTVVQDGRLLISGKFMKVE